jgi:hypothetical protein
MTTLWDILGIIVAVMALAFIVMSWRNSWRNLVIRRSQILPLAGQGTMADVERLVRAGERIAAIRVYREIHHVGLAEAKKAVDDLHVI